MSIRPYNELDWTNPNPYDLSYYYYLYEMLFERCYKSKLYLQNNLFNDGASNTPLFQFGGDFTQIVASSIYMQQFFNACRWLMFYHYKDNVVFNSSNYNFEYMVITKHLKYAERDLLTLLNIDSFYMPKFQTYNDKIFFIKSCYKMLKACRYSCWMPQTGQYQFFSINKTAGETWYNSWEDCKTAFTSSSATSTESLIARSESRWTWDGFNPDSWHEEFAFVGTNRLYFKSLYPVFRPNQSVKMYLIPCNANNYGLYATNPKCYIDGVEEILTYSLTADGNGFLTVDISFNLDDFFPQIRASASDTSTKYCDFRYYPIFLIDNGSFYQYT